MAFDSDPNVYISGIIFDSANIQIPYSSLGTFDENDIRSVMYAILDQVNSVYSALNAADKSDNMQIAKSPIFSPTTNITSDSFNFTFNIEYTCEPTILSE